MKTVWRVFVYLKRYPTLAIATLACAVVGTLMMIVPPAATKYILDNVINGHHPERLLPLLILVAFGMLVQRGLDYLRLLLNNTFEQRVIFDLRRDLYSHIQTLPLRWFDNRPTGDLMTRILEDVSSVERVLIDGIEKGTVAILQIVVVVAGMFYLSTKLALVALAPVPFLAGGALWYTLTAHRRYRLHRRAASSMNSLLHDNLSGIRQIKSFVREPEEDRRFNKESDELRRATFVVTRVWALYHSCWWWPWGRAIFYQALSSWGILGPFLCSRVFSMSQWGNCTNSINWCRQDVPRANASSKFSIKKASRRAEKRLLIQCVARLSSGTSVSAIPASCRR